MKEEEGNSFVFDVIRKKYVVLTPEEWVRQHFIHLMIEHLQYPKSLIRVETGMSYNSKLKRSDIQLINRDGTPFLLVECKAPNVNFNEQILRQISVYNKSIGAKYIALTNGIKHYIWSIQPSGYQQMDNFPQFT